MKIIKYLELNNKSTLSKLVVWKKRLLEEYIVLKATGEKRLKINELCIQLNENEQQIHLRKEGERK